jgi:hypothetical protein
VKNSRPTAPAKALIARPSVSLIARKAAARVIVKSGLRAGEARSKNPGT